MKKILTPLLLIVFGIQAFAQTYTISTDTAVFSDNISNVYINGIYLPVTAKLNVTNNSSITRTTVWVRNNIVTPSGWSTCVCDKNACYGNTISTKTFVLGPDSSGLLSVDFFPNSAGYAVTILHVFDESDSANSLINPVFVANISAATGIPTITKVKDIYLSPVPATNNLTIVYDNGLHPTKVEVYNILGKLMTAKKISNDASSQENIDVSGLDRGVYFLRFYTANNQVLTRQFTKD